MVLMVSFYHLEKMQASQSFEMDSLQAVALSTCRYHVLSEGQSSKAQGLLYKLFATFLRWWR
jgi:hypothetical protein